MIYTLTTCGWCAKAKRWFEDEGIPFNRVDVDSLVGEEAEAMAREVEEVSGGRRFPVAVVNGQVIVGFQPEKYAEAVERD
jgi:glutaredoxin